MASQVQQAGTIPITRAGNGRPMAPVCGQRFSPKPVAATCHLLKDHMILPSNRGLDGRWWCEEVLPALTRAHSVDFGVARSDRTLDGVDFRGMCLVGQNNPHEEAARPRGGLGGGGGERR